MNSGKPWCHFTPLPRYIKFYKLNLHSYCGFIQWLLCTRVRTVSSNKKLPMRGYWKKTGHLHGKNGKNLQRHWISTWKARLFQQKQLIVCIFNSCYKYIRFWMHSDCTRARAKSWSRNHIPALLFFSCSCPLFSAPLLWIHSLPFTKALILIHFTPPTRSTAHCHCDFSNPKRGQGSPQKSRTINIVRMAFFGE